MINNKINKISENHCFNGVRKTYSHESKTLKCEMKFAIYIPNNISNNNKANVLYWLSGLTCTEDNFMQKSGALKLASELGLIIVTPDTSPRGENIPDDKNNAYDFGVGAGFYLNATEKPWCENYNMYDYISIELPEIINNNFLVTNKKSISGHSMGGHGALVIYLKNQDKYSCASAFSPICNPINRPWGEKAFSNYLGNNKNLWSQYDACELIKQAKIHKPILIDQGLNDEFLESQLLPNNLIKAAKNNPIKEYPVILNLRENFDHSYYFISSFINDHIRFHMDSFN